ncbi:hypothetical protein FRC15_002229 [Serendipita sp. 397]|nr:hypothetical protein FRC15_002229 [Serendipita sp. 397]
MYSAHTFYKSAKECIMIQDWWLSPELYLRRPPAKFPEYRIDRLLKKKASEGVRIYIIVYKEVTQGMNLGSSHTKHHLMDLHENIAVIRHPDHIGTGRVLVNLNLSTTDRWPSGFHQNLEPPRKGRWDSHSHPLADAHPTDFSQTLFPGQEYNNARILE